MVQSVDIHIIMVPTPGGPVPTPLPNPFVGTITSGTSPNVKIEGMAAATVNSMATNNPPHIPAGGSFMNPPSNQGTVMMGSMSVMINGNPAARMGDMVKTCNDPVDLPTGTIICSSRVMIGGPAGPGSPPAGGGAQIVDQKFEPEKETAASQQQSKQKKAQGKGSLTVQALDVEGNPVPDCEYEIVFPNGERKKGRTNSDGIIDEQGIDPGKCEVHFYPEEPSESA